MLDVVESIGDMAEDLIVMGAVAITLEPDYQAPYELIRFVAGSCRRQTSAAALAC